MEKFNSIVDVPQNESIDKPSIAKQWLRKHIGKMVVAAVLVYAPEKDAEAQVRVNETINQISDSNTVEAQRVSDFHKMESVVNEDLEKKLEQIESEFGPAIESFLSLHRIKQDIDTFKKLEDGKDEPNIFMSKNGPQVLTLGSIVSKAYSERWEIHNPEVDKKTTLKNIDSIPNFSASDLESFLKERYSEKFIDNLISSIEFVPESNVVGNTEILGQTRSFDMDTLIKGGQDRRTPININLPTTGIDKDIFIDILEHEIGHTADWNNNNFLTSAQRVEMLFDIMSLLKNSDRYRSEYVEGINMEGLKSHLNGVDAGDEKTSAQYLNYVRATEYWPEIAKAYFKNPEEFRKNNEKDYKVVKKWIDIFNKNMGIIIRVKGKSRHFFRNDGLMGAGYLAGS